MPTSLWSVEQQIILSLTFWLKLPLCGPCTGRRWPLLSNPLRHGALRAIYIIRLVRLRLNIIISLVRLRLVYKVIRVRLRLVYKVIRVRLRLNIKRLDMDGFALILRDWTWMASP